jgi:hypothetical protein
MFDTAKLTQILNRQLTEEEEYNITMWEKGRALSQIRVLPGFDVVLEMLQSYVAKSAEEITKIDPKDRDEVNAASTVFIVANQLFIKFKQDVDAAIEAARKPPAVLSESLRHHTPGPMEGI